MPSTVPVKTYRVILYTAQFVVSPGSLSSLSHALPKLLTRLHITDESARIDLIEALRALADDYIAIEEERAPVSKVSAYTSRAIIARFLAVFGVLVTATSLRKIALNLKTPFKSTLTRTDMKVPAKYAISLALLTSAMPLLRTRLPQTTQSSVALAAASLAIVPEGSIKDYASIYALVQGVEALLQRYADNFPVRFSSYWYLMPLCLSQLLHMASTTPDYLPGLATRAFDLMYSGLVERKPVWYNAEWPKTIDAFVKIRKAKRVNRGLVYSEVQLVKTNPVHTNAKMAVMSPTEPDVRAILKNTLPRKALLLLGISMPLFYALYKYKESQTDSKSTTTGLSSGILSTSANSSCQDEYEEVEDINADIITTISKDDDTLAESNVVDQAFSYSPLPADIPRFTNTPFFKALISSRKLTNTVLKTTLTSYFLFMTPLPARLNGFLSGLWWMSYRHTASADPIFAYIGRITLLAMFKQKRDKYSKQRSTPFRLVGEWGATIVGALAVGILMKMHEEGRELGRFGKYVEYIKTGGGIVRD